MEEKKKKTVTRKHSVNGKIKIHWDQDVIWNVSQVWG